MGKKGFVNQKLGKQTSRCCDLAKLKVQYERRTQQQRGLESHVTRSIRKAG